MKSKVNPKSLKGLMKRLRESKIYPYVSNRYVMMGFGFFVWMLVFDDNNMIDQVERRYRIITQNQKIRYYNEEIAKVNDEQKALFGNEQTLEKFARERYRMLKDGEDLYLVINK